MPEWEIPVSWAMQAKVKVTADTLEEAKNLVLSNPSLPENGEYMEDSFQIDPDDDELLAMQEDESIRKVIYEDSWDELVALTPLCLGSIYVQDSSTVVGIIHNLFDADHPDNGLIIARTPDGKRHKLAFILPSQIDMLGGKGFGYNLIRTENQVRVQSIKNSKYLIICSKRNSDDD